MRRRRYNVDLDDLPWFRSGRDRAAPRIAGIVGGCVVALVATMVLGVLLPLIVLAAHSAGLTFLAAWAIIGYAIYRAVSYSRRRRDRDYEYDADDDAVEREYRRRRRHGGRVEEGERRPPRRIEVRAPTDGPPPPPSAVQGSERAAHAGLGDLALLVTSGIGLALAAGFLLSGRAGATPLNALLTGGLTLLGGGSIAALIARWSRPTAPADRPSDRQVRAQVKRIRGKCARLSREAERVGGVYSDLCGHAPSLAARAAELSELVLRLRRAIRDTRRRSGNPTLPGDLAPEPSDESLLREYQAAIAAQERLDRLIAANLRHQRACLAQLERIEDLVDSARLEVATPTPSETAARREATIIADVETELEASRRALQEIERLEQTQV